MSIQEDRYFTDFEGRFKARLSAVIPIRGFTSDAKIAPTTSKYDCRVKVEYQKDLMRLIEEGMILAVPNFKSQSEKTNRYTLLEIARIFPEHYGLRGLSDHSYYPLQFEVIDQSVCDWKSDDCSTMMIQINTIPANYDLLISNKGETSYEKGFTYPVIADKAYLLNKPMIDQMYNSKIIKKLMIDKKKLDPKIGIIKMFESDPDRIPIYVDFENLVRYHFGIFAFTGGGKSNLLSNILRKLIRHSPEIKVVIFDISIEYPFLLIDIFGDSKIKSKIILESPIENVEEFYASIVKPRDFEEDPRVKSKLEEIMKQGKVTYYVKPKFKIPTFNQILEEIDSMRGDSAGKPLYIQALDQIAEATIDYISSKKLSESAEIDEYFVDYLDSKASVIVDKLKVSDKSNIYAWATTRSSLKASINKAKQQKAIQAKGITIEQIRKLIDQEIQLTCLSITDPYNIKELVIHLSKEFLRTRKRQFKVKPYILFVFDEAQEFVPREARGIEYECSEAVETLLRQGRKYGLGGCVATQRIAYLNTSALQQLHTYFVGTLPRSYDRLVVSDAFMIDIGILEKTLEFAPGEWLLSSYIATGIENIPIFIKADNAEEELDKFLK